MGESGASFSKNGGRLTMNDMRKIILPEELCSAVEQKFSQHFGTLEELLTATLNELLHDDALRLDEQEQQIIEARLKALGYV
jgi:hypothetical protein